MPVSSTPASYFGSKFEMPWILDHFPASDSYDTFVDLFGGMAGITLLKDPSPVEVYNDINGDLVNFWRVCRDQTEALARALELTPVAFAEWSGCCSVLSSVSRLRKAARALVDSLPAESGALREEAAAALDGLDLGEYDVKEAIERARIFIVKARQSMASAPGKAWQCVVTHSRRGMASTCSAWLNMPATIRECGERFATVQIEQHDWRHVVKKYDSPRTLFYVDPPYHPDTCQTGVYVEAGGMDMSEAQHALLLRGLQRAAGGVVLSGYDHDLYERWLVSRWGWDKVVRRVPCRSAVKTDGGVAARTHREEVLWLRLRAGGGGSLFS